MNGRSAGGKGCRSSTIALLFLGLLAFIAIERGRRTDARLSAFCNSVPLVADLEATRLRARSDSFVVTDTVQDLERRSLTVSTNVLLWPRSWCRLEHDGASITGVSFNPWYE